MKLHDEDWNTFHHHPDWKKFSGRKEYKHTVSHFDKYSLYTADYSDY
ncbi:MAG: hypothetical protein J7L95_06105 [Prolixibacteraceae bacterium]|nr:hypothetical protein [Prolixibacteraceae bacterium]